MPPSARMDAVRVVRVGANDGKLRSWHYIYVYSIENRLIMRVMYESKSRWTGSSGNPKVRDSSLGRWRSGTRQGSNRLFQFD